MGSTFPMVSPRTAPAAHSLNRHKLAGRVQSFQQDGQGRELVEPGLDCVRCKNQRLGRRPGAGQVERTFAGAPIPEAPHRLAVEDDHPRDQAKPSSRDPAESRLNKIVCPPAIGAAALPCQLGTTSRPKEGGSVALIPRRDLKREITCVGRD